MCATVSGPLGPPEPGPPLRGGARWLRKLAGDFGRLAITSDGGHGAAVTEYDVQLNRDERGRLLGYALAGDDDTVHHLAADLSACDCPDGLAREGECNHQKGLKAALAQLGPLGTETPSLRGLPPEAKGFRTTHGGG
jgi:hypothetical protein